MLIVWHSRRDLRLQLNYFQFVKGRHLEKVVYIFFPDHATSRKSALTVQLHCEVDYLLASCLSHMYISEQLV